MIAAMHEINWQLRKANIADAAALSACMHAAYGVYAARLDGVILPPMTVDYEEEIRGYPVWVAEADGGIIGGLILMPEEDCMTIANIAIHPAFQGKGIGRDLMAHAQTEAGKLNYQELRLATHISLTENIAFYTRLGWSEMERDDRRIMMSKRIA